GEKLDKVRQTQGIRTVAISMTRTISPAADLKALWQLYRLFKKEKPDIVHTHTPKAGLLGMMAAKMAGVPHRLHTIAGLPLTVATGIKRTILNQTEKLTYASATRVYPNSHGLQKFVLENKFTSRDKLKVIGHGSSNGIDTSVFDPGSVSEETKKALGKELKIAKDDFIFLFVGRVVTDKGIHELVSAFKRLQERQEEIQLIIVGDYENDLDPLHPGTR